MNRLDFLFLLDQAKRKETIVRPLADITGIIHCKKKTLTLNDARV